MKKNNVLFVFVTALCSLLPAFLNGQWLDTTITVGSHPLALVWNSQNNKVYCANSNSSNVTVIDCQTNSVITTITVGTNSYALVWNSQNNKIYCANEGSSNVTVIDGQTNSVITTIPVGIEPRAFCWNSLQNRVYVANYASATVSVIRDSIISGVEENNQLLSRARLSIEIYPNPAKTLTAIRYSLPAESKISLQLYDISGRLVKTLVNESKKSGIYNVNLNTKILSAGVYFLSLQTESRRIIEKIVITK